MAADSTTDDTKENQQIREEDAITGSSNDATVIDLGVNTQPPEVDSKDFPSSRFKDMEKEKATSLHLELEVMKDEKEMLLRREEGYNSAAFLMQEPDKFDIQRVDIRSKGRGDPTEEKDSVLSPAAAPPVFAVESHSKKLNGTDLDDSNLHGSVVMKERSLEVKVKHGKTQQQKDRVTGVVGGGTKEVETNRGLTHMESSSVLGPKENKLMTEVKDAGSFSNNETKETCF